jgi:excisionase family DNA binding protein
MAAEAAVGADALGEVLTVEEASILLRINRKSLYQAISVGQVPGVIRIGRSIRISRDALECWLQNERG